jgi:Subtilase family
MADHPRVQARTFYLNEQHELTRGKDRGGGRLPEYAPTDWVSRGSRISGSLRRVKQKIDGSTDPLRQSHYFLLANPVDSIEKVTRDKTKAPPGGVATLVEDADFSSAHSRVFGRLGVDLLRVAEDGSAIVHMRPETLDQLASTSEKLNDAGRREQARWIAVDKFDLIPRALKVDEEWLEQLKKAQEADAVIELQPLLTRSEIDRIIRAIADMLRHAKERISGTGVDFSGRQWLRGRMLPASIRTVADEFFSVQSLHSPLISITAGPSKGAQPAAAPSPVAAPGGLPVIAVVDTGIPADHVHLAPYIRGAYTSPTATFNSLKDHASFVGSRAVFGDLNFDGGLPNKTPVGSYRVFDVNLGGTGFSEIEDKEVYPALRAVVATAPDVRVFNFSFDTRLPLDSMGEVERSEYLALVQDLDNFIFQNDVLVIVAAGNSPPGISPQRSYPRHIDDPQWALGAWARSFNSLTCGAVLGKLSAGGLATQIGWPSPFTRVGPGLCGSPKPDYVAPGGNTTDAYVSAPGLGVWGSSDAGFWEDRIGTSYAAPILCRQAAAAIQRLNSVCEKGARPFGVAVKAFLALTAEPAIEDDVAQDFISRTVGFGYADAGRLAAPQAHSAVLVWQGVLSDKDDQAKIQIPIPLDWLNDAERPVLRLVVSWDPPVNSALSNLWTTRTVNCRLHEQPESRALRTRNLRHASPYPLIERRYQLSKKGTEDLWLLEIEYEEIGEYNPAMEFTGEQRVAFAAELIDEGKKKVSPQAAIQAMPIAASMTRLAVPPSVVRTPVIVRTLG